MVLDMVFVGVAHLVWTGASPGGLGVGVGTGGDMVYLSTTPNSGIILWFNHNSLSICHTLCQRV